jgi:hypothetical protein
MAVLPTPRIAAFKPGQSPPAVKIPILFGLPISVNFCMISVFKVPKLKTNF